MFQITKKYFYKTRKPSDSVEYKCKKSILECYERPIPAPSGLCFGGIIIEPDLLIEAIP